MDFFPGIFECKSLNKKEPTLGKADASEILKQEYTLKA